MIHKTKCGESIYVSNMSDDYLIETINQFIISLDKCIYMYFNHRIYLRFLLNDNGVDYGRAKKFISNFDKIIGPYIYEACMVRGMPLTDEKLMIRRVIDRKQRSYPEDNGGKFVPEELPFDYYSLIDHETFKVS